MQIQLANRPHDEVRPETADTATPTRLVAAEALLLQPRDAVTSSTIIDRGPWPIFVIILDKAAITGPGALPLFNLLDRPRRNRILIVNSRYRWSIDSSGAALVLAVHADEPTFVDLEIVLPAQPLLTIFSQLPSGITLALTTTRHADKLDGRVAIREALREMVLLVSPGQPGNPSTNLAALRRRGKLSARRSTVVTSRPPVGRAAQAVTRGRHDDGTVSRR